MTELSVLGVDLASRSWVDNGTAILRFDVIDSPSCWLEYQLGVIPWPARCIDAHCMAEAIERFVIEEGIAATSLDGPQGWREPNVPATRLGVGRLCELEARTQGKTGEYGRTYPRNQRPWIEFCIDVFAELALGGKAILVNDVSVTRLPPPPSGKYYLLECFPTSIWRTSGLPTLPGKQNATPQIVTARANQLVDAYGLPPIKLGTLTHDNLQALVGSLPAAALLGGASVAVPRGKPASWPARGQTQHMLEGIIWDCKPLPAAP